MLTRLLISFALFLTIQASADETRLVHQLVTPNADIIKLVRPVEDESEALMVNFGLSLNHVDISGFSDKITVDTWAQFSWTDYRLRWDEAEFGGIDSVRLSTDKIWTPDIVTYSMAESANWGSVLAVVSSDGGVMVVAPFSFPMFCSRNASSSNPGPQGRTCTQKFGSWTYSGDQIDLGDGGVDLTTFQFRGGSRYHSLQAQTSRQAVKYDCCPETYVNIDLTVTYLVGARP